MSNRNIHLFGSTTTTGLLLKDLVKKNFTDYNLLFHSRKSKDQVFIDLNVIPKFNKLFEDNENIIISLAPIWLFFKILKSS